MAGNRTKLELTWIGKGDCPRLEPRVLVEDSSRSYHAPFGTDTHDIYDNRLIFGDNLLALKALEQEFTGKVKCIFIDPPYNTGSAFAHYDDGVEHSLWLSLMAARLEILRALLDAAGTLWVTVDDNEAHYLKVLLDEIFGRPNFIANVVWQKRTSPDARLPLGAAHDHMLVYARDATRVKLRRLRITEAQRSAFKNPDNDPRGPWVSTDFTAQGWRPNQMYVITTPAGQKYDPPEGRCWGNVEAEYRKLLADGRMWFGRDGSARPRTKTFLSESDGIAAWTWWTNEEVGHNQEAKKESIALFGADNAFTTPKPERLLERVIELATERGEIVLDSFAGSGTTGAVAHKLGRRWIMIELGEHCHSHIVPRLTKVVAGADSGGVTDSAAWKGGGGFRYYRLAASLLERDQFGNWVISKKYNSAMLAEAMCKLEGFIYAPSDAVYWQHGKSSDTDFLYVTTQTLGRAQLQHLSDEVGSKRTLLVLCGAYRARNLDDFPNLTVRKIPKVVLGRCEWGHDDYSLEIRNLPRRAAEAHSPVPPTRRAAGNGSTPGQKGLFDHDQE